MSNEMASLTGAYAVDALTGPERAEFEHHLAECGECAQEVRELRETAGMLGLAAAEDPPADLKGRVLHEITHTRQEPPTAAAPVPIGTRKSRATSRWATRLAAAASVVAIGLAAVFGVAAWQSQQELERAQQRIEQAGERGAEMARVLHAPDARIIHASEGRAVATAVVSVDLGKVVFMGEHMPAAPEDKVHQLWAIDEQGATSMGVLTGGDVPVAADMPRETTKLGVTTEPAGGSPQPTADPFMLLSLRA
ncbi:anti-sigma-K factor RskA [Prauserella isguenensis]|uniref:Regulator of SigK n=1 Tax=Prauserella isguenensis TaxID=1470180 RepID=A0A839RXS2_9PSEU|nr:anti-sigma factor [Prauserella isguenensis]MBB3050571.1 anti-sigma-K factor RskA [Prauserella isguenensis]